MAQTKKETREENISPIFNKLDNQDKIGHCHAGGSSGLWLTGRQCNQGKFHPKLLAVT